jgi:hypothetical protein
MTFTEVISWIVKGYIVVELAKAFLNRRPVPSWVYVFIAYYFCSLAWLLFWTLPHSRIFPVVFVVYNFVCTWTFLAFVLSTWVFIEYLFYKYARVRVFVEKNRKYFFGALFLVLGVICYVWVIQFNAVDNGVCRKVQPFEYFMYPYKMQARNRFWVVCYSFFLVSVLLIGSFACCFVFSVPISIA